MSAAERGRRASRVARALTVVTTLGSMLCAGPRRADAQRPFADSAARPAISTVASYTGELVADVAGATRRGAAFVGAASVQLTVFPRQIVRWPGAQIYVLLQHTHGGAPSRLVGDVQGTSNLEAPPGMRLEEAWLQQNLLSNQLSWLVGRYDLSTEFYRLQSAGLFVNSSFGTGPDLSQSGVAGPSIYPNTAVGTRVDIKPSPNAAVRLAVLDGMPVDRPGGGIHPIAKGDGAMLVGELALLSRPDTAAQPRHPRFQIGRGTTRPYAGKLALGGWYHTARFPDIADTLPTGQPVQHRGSRGAYLVGDQTVWTERTRAVTAFVQLGVGDARVNQTGSYLGGGLTFTAPFASRAQDELGVAMAMARNGSHFLRAQMATGMPTAGETAVELTYLAQLAAGVYVQPDLQYVIHPGGTRSVRNALVPGLRVALSR
jgi:porin